MHRAYRDLESAGLVEARHGRGTFVSAVAPPATTPERQAELAEKLAMWMDEAREAGLDDAGVLALVALSMQAARPEQQEIAL